jgi:iron complex outermembrane receptor protein
MLSFPIGGMAQSDCALSFEGTVVDAQSGEPLSFGTIFFKEPDKGAVTDEKGRFQVKSLCPGTYTVVCSFLGYASGTMTLVLSQNTTYKFRLQPETKTIQEVEVTGQKEKTLGLATQVQAVIKDEDLIKTRGATLGEALVSIPGVYVLQTGPSIFKPVIHGLHSNRILIFNNGVRQEGQQWGSEHAPEIDPFIATKLAVLRGAASLRYGSDAIGGVISVEPAPMPQMRGISGEVNVVGATNNRMGVVSGIVQGAFDRRLKGLSWRAQGTLRRAGNSKTPHYYLENTGFQEINFSTALSYRHDRFGADAYYSEFDTKLGIFTGSSAETVSDLQAAIDRPRPITPSYFGYAINRPFQTVKHELLKADAFNTFANGGRLDLVFARQVNVRSEYDYVPLNGAQTPELYLRLITHTLDAIYQFRSRGRFSATAGFNGITQGNVRMYQILIPNFRTWGGGVFYTGRWTTERLRIEGGMRYDYRWTRAYMLDNTTVTVVTPTFRFQHVTGAIGSEYNLKDNLSWNVNIGTAWRAPSVSELLSNGVHQSAVDYEEGNPNLKLERAYNASTSLHYHGKRVHGEVGVYNNIIDGYIFLKPSGTFIHTSRGAFPLFNYTQVNARFRGIDAAATVRVIDSLTYTTKVSMLYAWNYTIHDYLQLIPANRYENSLRYGFGDLGALKQFYLGVAEVYVARQRRVPTDPPPPAAPNDFKPPPPGYALLNASLGFMFPLAKHMATVSLTAANLLNLAYRDYMDRFRYFNDEPGRNFTVRLRVPFGTLNNSPYR